MPRGWSSEEEDRNTDFVRFSAQRPSDEADDEDLLAAEDVGVAIDRRAERKAQKQRRSEGRGKPPSLEQRKREPGRRRPPATVARDFPEGTRHVRYAAYPGHGTDPDPGRTRGDPCDPCEGQGEERSIDCEDEDFASSSGAGDGDSFSAGEDEVGHDDDVDTDTGIDNADGNDGEYNDGITEDDVDGGERCSGWNEGSSSMPGSDLVAAYDEAVREHMALWRREARRAVNFVPDTAVEETERRVAEAVRKRGGNPHREHEHGHGHDHGRTDAPETRAGGIKENEEKEEEEQQQQAEEDAGAEDTKRRPVRCKHHATHRRHNHHDHHKKAIGASPPRGKEKGDKKSPPKVEPQAKAKATTGTEDISAARKRLSAESDAQIDGYHAWLWSGGGEAPEAWKRGRSAGETPPGSRGGASDSAPVFIDNGRLRSSSVSSASNNAGHGNIGNANGGGAGLPPIVESDANGYDHIIPEWDHGEQRPRARRELRRTYSPPALPQQQQGLSDRQGSRLGRVGNQRNVTVEDVLPGLVPAMYENASAGGSQQIQPPFSQGQSAHLHQQHQQQQQQQQFSYQQQHDQSGIDAQTRGGAVGPALQELLNAWYHSGYCMGKYEAATEAEARQAELERRMAEMRAEMDQMRAAMRALAPKGSPFSPFL